MIEPTRKGKSLIADLTRQHIIEAVIRLITTEGVSGITMDKAASEAGVAKGTLYRYFRTKSDLLRATMDHCMAPVTEELFGILSRETTPDRRLELMIHHHLSYFDRHRDFFRVLLYDRGIAQTKTTRYGSNCYRAFVERTAAVVEEGMKSGVFRPLDPLKVASVLIEASIAIISRRLICESPGRVEHDAGILCEVLLNGISSRPEAPGEA